MANEYSQRVFASQPIRTRTSKFFYVKFAYLSYDEYTYMYKLLYTIQYTDMYTTHSDKIWISVTNTAICTIQTVLYTRAGKDRPP